MDLVAAVAAVWAERVGALEVPDGLEMMRIMTNNSTITDEKINKLRCHLHKPLDQLNSLLETMKSL